MDLPIELLTQISCYLDKNSVQALSKVNTLCRAACAPQMYHDITLSSDGIYAHIEHLRHLRQHIRLLRIKLDAAYTLNAVRTRTTRQAMRRYPQTIDAALVAFLHSLPVLTDLYWSGSQSILHSVLVQLVKLDKQRKCRLYLQEYTPTKGKVKQLASLPLLYSIDIHFAMGHTHLAWHSRVYSVIAAAPHIKELHINDGPSISLASLQPGPATAKGALTSLKVGAGQRGLFRISSMSLLTDLRILNTLHIEYITADCATWLASCGLLHNLKDLKIGFCTDFVAIERFVLQLSLESLELGLVEETSLGQMLDHIGHRLRRLQCIATTVAEEWIHTHLEPCQSIEALGIGICRRQDRSTMGVYSSIARLPRLRHLALCFTSLRAYELVGDEDISSFDSEQQARIYFALRDSAMDERLAASIFTRLSTLMGGPRLQTLAISATHIPPSSEGTYGPHLAAVMAWLTRRIDCTANPRDDCKHRCTTLLHSIGSPLSSDRIRQYGEGEHTLALVLQRLWPRSDDVAWTDVCHSFPDTD